MGRPANFKFIARNVHGREEGQRVDVIPVGMRDEDLGLEPRPPVGEKMVRERLDAAPSIEDEEAVLGELKTDARRVAAVSKRLLAGDGQRAAHAPKDQFDVVVDDALNLIEKGLGHDRLDDETVGAEA